MNKILILALALMSTVAMANHHEGGFKHMIEFNKGGFGADYSSQTIEAGTNELEEKTLELTVNYAHKLTHNIWIQGILGYEGTNTEGFGTDEDETTINLIIAGIYNFNHDATNSFYGKLGFNLIMLEEEDNSANTTTDTNANQFFVEFGKRWSLEKWTGIKNISYVASVAYGMGSGDIDNGTSTDIDLDGFVIQLLGVSLFF